MTDVDLLKAADRRLQAAQRAADADALDRLIDDRLVFTGPDGRLYSKQDDLELQRTGQQQLTELTEEELTAVVVGGTGITWFLGRLAGRFQGEDFTAYVRYTRTWISTESGWQLLAAHVSPAAAG
jgi:ketosteroid isomerase-like protein